MWEIIDSNGTIHSGDQTEMEYAFSVMCNPNEYGKPIRKQYSTDWEGDLKLIQVHQIHK